MTTVTTYRTLIIQYSKEILKLESNLKWYNFIDRSKISLYNKVIADLKNCINSSIEERDRRMTSSNKTHKRENQLFWMGVLSSFSIPYVTNNNSIHIQFIIKNRKVDFYPTTETVHFDGKRISTYELMELIKAKKGKML